MYNEKILNQLDNLKYLGALKGSNISVVSKPNEFGDTVKFYAQINQEEVIQKITYRASGCTHFLVFCNYFCSLVEGKTITQSLNVKQEKLENFVELDDSKKHIIPIILDAFALLVKKYRKGVEKGKIQPCEIENKNEDAPKNRPMTPKQFTKVLGEIVKNIELSHKNNNQINVSKNFEAVGNSDELVDIQIKEDVNVKENKLTGEVSQDTQKVAEKKVIEKKNAKVVKDNITKVESRSKNIAQDELLENLVDKGVVLDDLLVDNTTTFEEPSVEKEVEYKEKKLRIKKATKKTIQTTEGDSITEEKSIDELNKEITGLIDVLEKDVEITNVVAETSSKDIELVIENKNEEDKKQKEVKTSQKKNTKKTTEDSNKKNVAKKQNSVSTETENKEKSTKQANNLLTLKSMLNNRDTNKVREEKVVEEKKSANKINNLSAMISKMQSVSENAEQQKTNSANFENKKKDVSTKEDKLSSLKLSIASISSTSEKTSNSNENAKNSKKVEKNKTADSKTSKNKNVKNKDEKSCKTKSEKKTKEEKVSKKQDKEINKQNKKVDKRVEEQQNKKAKKNDYDMEYEAFDDTQKKGFFSWLRRK